MKKLKEAFLDTWHNKSMKWVFLFCITISIVWSIVWSLHDGFVNLTVAYFFMGMWTIVTIIDIILYYHEET